MKLLVTGGAGYIGSATVRKLLEAGHAVAVLDNLEKGHRVALPQGVPLFVTDLRRPETLSAPFRQAQPEAVVHFAAYSLVGESVAEPGRYFHNNVLGGLHLLEAMQRSGCRRIVFSSTAAVYGQPQGVSIREDDPTVPTNPYGDSKLAFEKVLLAYRAAYGFNTVSLRYFNAAGALDDSGEDHDPETHLIPILLQCALGQREKVQVFGDDYDTPDGTCIRDYIHIGDLADAHVLAVEYAAERSGVFNLGNGAGFSVQEVLETARRVTGHAIPAEVAPRRSGDPPRLVAGAERARSELGWRPRRADLAEIIQSAWNWTRMHPHGYEE